MKGFNNFWRLLPSSPKVWRPAGFGDPFLSKKKHDRFPTTTLGNDNNIVWGVRVANACAATAGFTLIELLIVVLIIGILSAVALPQYNKAVEKSRATEALTMIRAAIQAEEAYYLANGEYTNDMEALDISIPSTDNFYLESLADGDEDDSRIQIYNERTGMRSWWIYYYKNKTLNCQVEKEEPSGSLARSVCKSFSSKEVTCLEPEYDCYVMN